MASSYSKTRKLIIFGTEDFADIAFEYFTHDSPYEVVAFTADRAYVKDATKFGLPVVAFEDIEATFSPDDCHFFGAVVYAQLNRLREDVCKRAKVKGYQLASYVSSRAFVWRNVKLGEHCFIFEDNTVQPFASIGDNVVLWSGNHIGHHSKIGNHCFLTSHVVVSGWVEIGDYCFVGVNSTLANNTRVGDGCWINHGACLSGDIEARSLVRAGGSEITPLNEAVLFRSLARSSRARPK
ncbi:acetyltransferase [Afipia massiliensis]|uniref:Acetyltransferase n=1 Tax=Afipia massiliensis TaxID=211460 RepID=A0A4U6BQS4_9BRAD|nr:acetyltransferase [Afipia massiliensis]TKT72910.1 acetyltransferase [Afipia massiliensis]